MAITPRRIRNLTRNPWLVAGLLLGLTTAVGCRDDVDEDLARLSDEISLARLAELPPDANLLVSLEGRSSLAEAPDPGPAGRLLSSFDSTYLLEVDRARLIRLAALSGVKRILVWGDAALGSRLGAQLRLSMLSRVAGEELREAPLEVVARFDGDVLDLRHRLEMLGAEPQSVNAGVVTLSAPVDVLIEILGMPDLVQLKKPVRQQLMQSSR